MTDTITLPRAVIQDAIESIQGYARETGDTQPCDAEKALSAALAQQAEPTHYLDAMGLCYTVARAKFIGMDAGSMVALYAASQVQQQAEQGWVRVPVEPTQEMINAGRTTPMPSDSEFDEDEDYRAVFIAMVAAAPKGGL